MITWIYSTLYVIPLVWSRTISNCCYAVYNESMETFAQSVQSTTLSGLSPRLSSQLKSFSKDLCKKKLDWDEKITEDLSRWKALLKELPKLQGFSTGQCFKPSGFCEVASAQLHYRNRLWSCFLPQAGEGPWWCILFICHWQIQTIPIDTSHYSEAGAFCCHAVHQI